MKRAVPVAAMVALVACSNLRPSIRPGPPVTMRFAPPPGGVQITRAVEVRTETLDFPKGTTLSVRHEARASAEERYEKLDDGGYRVTTTLLEAVTTRDGTPLQDRFSLVGISLVHRVDSLGRFLGMMDVKESLDAIHARLTNADVRRMIEPLLSPGYLSAPLQKAWERRFDDVCGKPVSPGAVFYSLDDQPTESLGDIRTLVRATAVGASTDHSRPSLDVALEFGGRSSEFANSPGALDVFLGSAEGVKALSDHVHGDGRRVVDASTCQTLSEEVTLQGEGRLNDRAAHQQNTVVLPLHVHYEVHRQVLRVSRTEAEAMGIPTNIIHAVPAFTAPPATSAEAR